MRTMKTQAILLFFVAATVLCSYPGSVRGADKPAVPVALTSMADYERLSPALTPAELSALTKRAEAGDAVACDGVFCAYFFGFGTPIDHDKARLWLDRAYQARGPIGIYYQGRCLCGFYLRPGNDNVLGTHLVNNARDALLPFAEKGNSFAMFYVGSACNAIGNKEECLKWMLRSVTAGSPLAKNWYGCTLFDTAQNLDKDLALKYLRESAESGFVMGQHDYGRHFEINIRNFSEARKWYEKSAERGFDEAKYDLGRLLVEGSPGVERNTEKAVALFKEAAAHGSSDGQYHLAELYYYGMEVKQDYLESARLYKLGADQGHPLALTALGWQYNRGLGVKKDEGLAFKYFKQSADLGCHKGYHMMAMCYQYGAGVKQDSVEEFKWLQKAAVGCADGSHRLAIAYLTGKGTPIDKKKAFELLKTSLQYGDHAPAMTSLGRMYYLGDGVEKNLVLAANYYRQAAEHDDSDGQYLYGVCLLQGDGVEKQLSEAAVWFTKSAKQGDKKAQYLIGMMKRDGSGVDRDLAEAFKWLDKSAKQNCKEAQLGLAEMYNEGLGVPKDEAKAKEWLDKANGAKALPPPAKAVKPPRPPVDDVF